MGRRNLKFWRWLLQQKYYFDKGLGLFGYLKYVIIGIGISFKDFYLTIIMGIVTSIFCYILGFLWTRKRLGDLENDISNQYNPFVSKTLRLLGKNKKFK